MSDRVRIGSLAVGSVWVENRGCLRAAEGAVVYLYKPGDYRLVKVYAAEGGTDRLQQPLVADSRGDIPGWVEQEAFDAVVIYQGTTVVTPCEPTSHAGRTV